MVDSLRQHLGQIGGSVRGGIVFLVGAPSHPKRKQTLFHLLSYWVICFYFPDWLSVSSSCSIYLLIQLDGLVFVIALAGRTGCHTDAQGVCQPAIHLSTRKHHNSLCRWCCLFEPPLRGLFFVLSCRANDQVPVFTLCRPSNDSAPCWDSVGGDTHSSFKWSLQKCHLEVMWQEGFPPGLSRVPSSPVDLTDETNLWELQNLFIAFSHSKICCLANLNILRCPTPQPFCTQTSHNKPAFSKKSYGIT